MRISIVTAFAIVMALVAPAFAAMDCSANLEKYSMMVAGSTHSVSKRMRAQHMALSGYKACMAGDEAEAKTFWQKLNDLMR